MSNNTVFSWAIKMLRGVISLLALCSVYVILFHIQAVPQIGGAKNFMRINEVLLNLSYSYLAGLIFFLFNSGVPSLVKKLQVESALHPHMAAIQYDLCYIESILSIMGESKKDRYYVRVLASSLIKRHKEDKVLFVEKELQTTVQRVLREIMIIDESSITELLDIDKRILLSEIKSALDNDKCINHNQIKQISRAAKSLVCIPSEIKIALLPPAKASEIENTQAI